MIGRKIFNLCGLPLLTAVACFCASSRVCGQSLTGKQYDQALAIVQRDAETEGDNPRGYQTAIGALQPLLRCAVKTASGDIVFVDNRPILAQMKAAQQAEDANVRSNKWSAIAKEIALIHSDMPAGEASSEIAPTNIAKSVLIAKEFSSDPLPAKSVWDKMAASIKAWLKKLHFKHSTAPSGTASPLLPLILLITILVIAMGLIIFFVANWLRGREFGSDASSIDSGLALTFQEKELVASHNYTGLRALADEAASRRDFRTAFRLMFVATLVYLDAEGAIKLDRSKTNWEYLKAIAANADLREQLRPFVQDFDRIWYGSYEATQQDFDHAGERYASIQQLVAALAPIQTTSGASKPIQKPVGVS